MLPDRATTVAIAVVAGVLLWPPPSPVRGRLRSLGKQGPPSAGIRAPTRVRALSARHRRLLIAAAAGLAVTALLGGVLGVLAGTGAAVAADRLLRSATHDAGWSTQDLPLTCDLLGVCLGAGLPVPSAIAAVSATVGEPVGSVLAGVAARYRMGAEPRQAWADTPAELAALARVVSRAGRSGSAVRPALHELAADARAAERGLLDERVRRSGVLLLAPLGACFLPAFLCLGVVPLVLGIAGSVFR